VSLNLLLNHFETIAEAPGGIARLRQLILQLAVQGRLVEQNLNDQPASVLLRGAKRSAVDEGFSNNRKRKVFTTEKYPALPEYVPIGWHLCLLEDCLVLINGRAYAQTELLTQGTPVLRIQNLNNSEAWYYSDLELPSEKYCDKGDLLFAWSATFGPYIWRGPKVIYHYHIWKVLPSEALDKHFGYYLLLYLTEQVREQSHGLAMLHMTKAQMEQWPILLPPLAEQRRIVERVDQLLALCDALEQRQARRDEERKRLLAALIDSLLGAAGPDEVAAAWARLRDGFDLAFDAPESVAPLRQAVLQLAVQGRLVEQDPADEPAGVLLERIRKEKARLVRKEKQKKVDPLSEVISDQQPFQIPGSWEWVRLATLITFGPSNGISPKAVETPTSIKSLTLTATTSGKFDGRYFKYIDEKIAPDSDLWLENGDVLVQRGNTLDYVGVTAIYNGPPYEYVYPDLMIKLRMSSEIEVAYLHTAMNSRPMRDYLRSRAMGTSGSMPKINHATLVSLPIPLPPLAEQRRIVERVDQLMALCDDLEAKLREERAAAAKVADVLCQAITVPQPSIPVPAVERADDALVLELPMRQPMPVIQPVEAETILLAYALQQHQGTRGESTLGHVKAEKIVHLTEAIARRDLGRQPRRLPRGPADPRQLERAIAVGRRWGAFDVIARQHAAWGYQFVPGANLATVAARFVEVFAEQAATAARVVDLLVPLKSRQAEAVATLYTVWNDLLRAGEQPDDEQLFAAFRAFHTSKERFQPAVLIRWLTWMRERDLVPDGQAKPTVRAEPRDTDDIQMPAKDEGRQTFPDLPQQMRLDLAAPIADHAQQGDTAQHTNGTLVQSALGLADTFANDDNAYTAVRTLLVERGALTNSEVQVALGLDAATARALLRQLVAEGAARQEGERRGTRYVMCEAPLM
jgi:type I restriction enzyme, S subunit